MSSNTNNYRVSNEQLLLINILNTMYNDNLRQINNLNDTLNNIQENNNQIRNLLIQLLNVNSTSNTRRSNNDRRSQQSFYRSNNPSPNSNNFGQLYVDNRPYIIDSISHYTFPLRNYNNRNNSNSDSFTRIFNSFMQPVEVYPTQTQVEAATRIVRYCDITRPVNNQCPISLENFEDNDMVTVIRPCGHIFNTEHINNWFRSNCRCPVCRYDIREYNSNASNEFFSNNSFNNNPISDASTTNTMERNSNENSQNLNYQNLIESLLDSSGNYIDNGSSNNILTNYLFNILNQTRNV